MRIVLFSILLAAFTLPVHGDLQARCGAVVHTARDFGFDGPELGGQCNVDYDIGPVTLLVGLRHLEVEKLDTENPGNRGDQQGVSVGAEWRFLKHLRAGASLGLSQYAVRDFSKDTNSASVHLAYEGEGYRLYGGLIGSQGDRNRARGGFVGLRMSCLGRSYLDQSYHRVNLRVRNGAGAAWVDSYDGATAAQLVVGWEF